MQVVSQVVSDAELATDPALGRVMLLAGRAVSGEQNEHPHRIGRQERHLASAERATVGIWIETANVLHGQPSLLVRHNCVRVGEESLSQGCVRARLDHRHGNPPRRP